MRDLLPQVHIPWTLLLCTPFLVLLFAGIVWWVLRKERRDVYEYVQDLPFDEEKGEDDGK